MAAVKSVRPRAANGRKARPTKKSMEDDLRIIKRLQGKVNDANRKLVVMEQELFTNMESTKTAMLSTELGGAEIVTPMGRSSTNVDPMALSKIVTKAQFMACIKVMITETKKIITETAFDKLAVVTPGTKGARKLIFTK